MSPRSLIVWSLAILLPAGVRAQHTDFSEDSAHAFLKHLAVDIGPRPMGSPRERAALEYAVRKFAEYGCEQSYVMPVTVADGVNTTSGNAIGVLQGNTNRIIVIGGHIDSASPDVPGANDNGSGTACVIELARVLGKRQHESTILFCCWGGEERGLLGSKYFVQHFPQMDSIALMVQLDMADGASVLEIDPDAAFVSAPAWLTRAAYDIFYNDLKYSGLVYPIFSATLDAMSGGATGSDHESFLRAGIPAVDFTSDVNFPIHTPQDNLGNFTPSGLTRTGELVMKLVERFDAGVPSRTTERYMLVQVGSYPLILSYWLLWTLVSGVLVLSLVAFVVSRSRGRLLDADPKVKWSGMKLMLFAFLIQIPIWLSANIVGLVRGYRFPWVNNFGGFLALGILTGGIGLWVFLQGAGRFRLSSNPHVFARVAFTLFLVATILASISSPESAVIPATMLLCFSLAMLVRPPAWKALGYLVLLYIGIRVAFPEWLQVVQRMIAATTMTGWSSFLFSSGITIAFAILSTPFVFGFAAVYRSAAVDLFWLKRFRKKGGLVVTSAAFVALMVYLSTRPVYDRLWYSTVRVHQRYGYGSASVDITMKGSEFFKGMRLRMDGKDTVFSDRTNLWMRTPANRFRVTWCALERDLTVAGEDTESDSTRVLHRRIEVRSRLRPLEVTATYRSDLPFEASSPWAQGGGRFQSMKDSGRSSTLSWYSYPDTNLSIPVTFLAHKGQKISETIEITYDSLAYPMELQREYTNFIKRTIVIALDTLRAASPASSLAETVR